MHQSYIQARIMAMKTSAILYVVCGIGMLAACLPAPQPTRQANPTAIPTSTTKPMQSAVITRTPVPSMTPSEAPKPLPLPPEGYLYHGVYPGGVSGEESDLTLSDLRAYEEAAGKRAAWVYFSHNWYEGRDFPLRTATWIREAGSVPFIRLMLRSSPEQNVPEPLFTLQAILDGTFDGDLQDWCTAARRFDTPLLVEYGTEVNGAWFPWNGTWHGGGETQGYGDPSKADGPERFVDAYRHIIQICRQAGAHNLTWVFHVNANDWPDESWNALEHYYPGDEWIDWIGISNYGAQTPLDDYCDEFRLGIDAVYPRIQALAAHKPIIIAEFGVTQGNPLCDQALWARRALSDLISFRWPRLIGFSWWNEQWQNDENPAHDTTMRLQDNAELAAAFQEMVGSNAAILGSVDIPALPSSPQTTVPSAILWWQAAPRLTWQWQLSTLPTQVLPDVDVYDIDLFDADASLVAALKAQGVKVICYLSAGSWEEWRPDAELFPAEVIGKEYASWEGEKWLDIRAIDTLAPILRARLDLCAAKGFEAVEPDNIDGYTNDTGFPLTYADQLAFNMWLADEAHARGLSIGLKNDPEQAAHLLQTFDWALTEDCFADGWCEMVRAFVLAGKAVFAAEYTDNWEEEQFLNQVCPQALALGFSAILKERELDEWVLYCP